MKYELNFRNNSSNYYLYNLFSAGNLSHQLSTCSAVSLPSKIDNICSEDELCYQDDQEYEINDEDDEPSSPLVSSTKIQKKAVL